MSTFDDEAIEPAAAGVVRYLSLWDLLRVSRTGLIVSHLWLFLLPVMLSGTAPGIAFWIGALYLTVPLGMLIYGWNDYFDADVDRVSGRKKDHVMAKFFGYRLEPAKRRLLPGYIVALQLPFLVLAAVAGHFWVFGWLAVMVVANGLYNGPGLRLSRLPALAESTATWIYLNILWLSVILTGLEQPWTVWALAAAAVLLFQIAGAIVDIGPDRRVGKLTFAAAVGERRAAQALAGVVAFKAVLLWAAFEAPVAATLNLAAIPVCLAKPSFPNGHWSGLVYVYFVVVDWTCLLLLAA